MAEILVGEKTYDIIFPDFRDSKEMTPPLSFLWASTKFEIVLFLEIFQVFISPSASLSRKLI